MEGLGTPHLVAETDALPEVLRTPLPGHALLFLGFFLLQYEWRVVLIHFNAKRKGPTWLPIEGRVTTVGDWN